MKCMEDRENSPDINTLHNKIKKQDTLEKTLNKYAQFEFDHTLDEYSSAIFQNSCDLTDCDFDDATDYDPKEPLEKESEEYETEEILKARKPAFAKSPTFQFETEYSNFDSETKITYINPIFGNAEIHSLLLKSRKNWDIQNYSIIERLFGKKRKTFSDIMNSNGISKSKSREPLEVKEKEKEGQNQLKEMKNPVFHKFVQYPKNSSPPVHPDRNF